MKIGFTLLDARFRPGKLCALFAVVETGEHGALWHAITDVGAKVNEHARNLEADLGGDARLDRAETEDLNRDVLLNACGLDLDRLKEHAPRADNKAGADRDRNCQQDDAF